MKRTLIVTVGGSDAPNVQSISEHNPDHVSFVCSTDDPASGHKGSYTQVEKKGGIADQTNLTPEQYEILQVPADNIDQAYTKLLDWLEKRDRQEKIIADFTGGTKAMSAALVMLAIDRNLEATLVTGARTNLQKVQSGRVVSASIQKSRFLRQLEQILKLWESHAYDQAALLLQRLTPPDDERLRARHEQALEISRAFAAWDRFDHKEAHAILEQFKPRFGPIWGASYYTQLRYLTANDPARNQPWKLFDLWNNAQRRALQQRYDDAVARTYRLIEWSAQWLLKSNLNIDTANVPADRVPESIALSPDPDGTIRAPLFKAWELAAHHIPSVKGFWDENASTLRELIGIRNHSILAHGYTPIEPDQWQRLSTWVENNLLPLLLNSTKKPGKVTELPQQLPTQLPKP